MRVSADYLLRCSVETGFPAATLERVVRLGELAADVARHPVLGFAALDEGELRLELLFPDEPAEAARLSAHPALQWKLSNLGQSPSRRSRS